MARATRRGSHAQPERPVSINSRDINAINCASGTFASLNKGPDMRIKNSRNRTEVNIFRGARKKKEETVRVSSVDRPDARLRFAGLRNEFQRDAVIAKTLAGRRGPVVEHVAMMAAAADAVILGARVKNLVIRAVAEHARYRREETRPAGTAFEFHCRREDRQIA